MIHRAGPPLLVLGALLATACTTTGTGFGSTTTGSEPTTFQWKSTDNVSGQMTATLANGKTYTGQFFQITSNTTADTLGPLWTGWGPGWRRGGWYDWDAGPEFVTHYSGKVVANLVSTDKTHLRCSFQLVHPSEGLAGGGQGECQAPDGARIDAQLSKVA